MRPLFEPFCGRCKAKGLIEVSTSGLFFFFLFALLLVGVYIALRRQLAPARILSGAGILGGIFTMTLFAGSQEGVLPVHAILVGILIGGGLSLGVIILAWYFLTQETRTAKAKHTL